MKYLLIIILLASCVLVNKSANVNVDSTPDIGSPSMEINEQDTVKQK